ncbi:MAG: glycosyltransferase family 9 protein [Bauldia sp.]|nr:glycosyltransferase family 9 protein [Bauldia sp.]
MVRLGFDVAGVDPRRCRRILVVKLDFIGDWVLTTPLLASLRRFAPQAEITAVVLERVFSLAVASRLVDRVIAVPAASAGPVRFGAGSAETLAAFLRDFGEEGGFDLALVPRWDTDFNGATRIAGLSGAPVVVGFSEQCTPRRARDNAGFDRFLSVAILDRRNVHEVEHALGMIEALGGAPSPDLRVDLPAGDISAATRFVRSAFTDGRRLLAVAPFAAGRRQWPSGRLSGVVAALADRFALDVVVITSPDAASSAHAFAADLAGRGIHAATSVEALDLRGNAALLGMAALFIGMDSGPAHLAVAQGVPAIVLTPNPLGSSPAHTGAPERFRPWTDASRLLLLRPAAHMPPCTDGCDSDGPHCVLGLETGAVRDATLGFAGRVLVDPAQGFQR